MGFTILLDLAILLAFAVGAFLGRARATRLSCSVVLIGLCVLDLLSQVWASQVDRIILDAAYPLLYPAMLTKNLALLALGVYATVRTIEQAQEHLEHADERVVHAPPAGLAHRPI